MTDGNIELTRRKILGSVGAVGVAGAAAGFGTSALFSDTESLANNEVVAGELDLKVDWEEHYSFPQIYGFDDPTDGLDVTRSEPGDTTDYVGLPDPENPVVWVHSDDLEEYMDNTSIEAFPDPDNDGVQEIDGSEDDDVNNDFTYDACEDGADLPDDLGNFDPENNDAAARTENADTTDEAGEREPLINLTDVKPGDFGEFTFSFHLCDNPGYVWLQAAEVSEDGGANPEAEQEAEGDEDNDANLAENIETVWWYDDDGDNVIDEEIGEVDVMIAVDTSGSLTESDVSDLESDANQLATDLVEAGDARVGGLSFGDGSIDDFTSLSDSPVSFSGLSPGGNTPTPAALDIAAAELDANARSGAETVIVLLTDGGPNYSPDTTYSAGEYNVGPYGDGETDPGATVGDSELEETAGVASAICEDHRIITVGINDDRKPSGREGDDPSDIFGTGSNGYLSSYLEDNIACDPDDYFQAEDSDAVSSLLETILEAIASTEQVFRRGTLDVDLTVLSSGTGIPLDGDRSTDFDEIGAATGASEPGERECFEPSSTEYIGFGWWVPEDVGNEIQGDSVSFDLGFYTEQCRNNDDPGQTFGNS